MARVGVSYPRYAKYTNSGTTVTYSAGGSLGKATTVSVELDGADNNILYADNGPAESVRSFSGGNLTIGTDDLYDAAAKAILGWTDGTDGEIIRKADTTPDYMGVGFVIKHIRSGVAAYTGVVLTKVQFADPGFSVDTQGENIDWQTPELEATILRDDTADAVWCRHKTVETEALARTYVDGLLNISA